MRLIPQDDDLGWTPYAWTVYVAFFAISPALAHNTKPLHWLVSIGGTIALLALYFRGYWVRGLRIVPIIAAMTLLGVLIFPTNTTAGVFFVYAASFAARLDNDRAAVGTIAAIEVVVGIEAFLAHLHPFTFGWVVVFVAL